MVAREKLIEFIRTKVLDENGFFNGHTQVARTKWYKAMCYETYYNEIVTRTEFLGVASVSERIHCLLNNINDKKKCLCGEKIFFKGFVNGYPITCGSNECLKKHYNTTILQNGLTVKEENIKRFRLTMQELTPEGITKREAATRKTKEEMFSKIINGKNAYQRAALTNCNNLRNTIYEDGKTGLQKRARKAVENNKKKIVDGLDNNQRTARKAAETMKKVQADGLTQYQKNAAKCRETKLNQIDENGLNGFQRQAYASAKTKKQKIDPKTGLTIHDIQIQKMKVTRSTNIDNKGLDGFDRSFYNGAGRNYRKFYNDTKLSYQGSLEKDFLDRLTSFNLFDFVRPGKFVIYQGLDDKEHYYHPDFLLVPLSYFEIKCLWTYDYNGTDENLRKTNHLKWKSVLETVQGSKMFVVWNRQNIQQITLDDLIHYDYLYQPEKFQTFNKENLQTIVGNF